MVAFVTKSEGASLTYEFDYQTNFLDLDASPAEEIQSSVWDVEPDEGSPGDLLIDTETETGQATAVRIRGGTNGDVYRVRNRISTTYGNTDEKTLVVIIGP